MSIDATDIRDLINNQEGRLPYPEDSKVMLGSTPSGGISDEQLQSILDRLTALENASGSSTEAVEYELHNEGGFDADTALVTKLIKKGEDPFDVWEGNSLTLERIFNKTDSDGEVRATVPVPVYFHITNKEGVNNLDAIPEFEALSASNFLKSSEFGWTSGAWNVVWDKVRTPVLSWAGDGMTSNIHKNVYMEHNSVLLSATLGANADGSTHQLDATYFFTNLLNEFLNNVIKPSITDNFDNVNNTIKFSIVDLGGNFMSLTDSVKDAVTRQIVIVNNNSSNYSSYITQTLGTKLSGALGAYGIHIEWDKNVNVDDNHTYEQLGVVSGD